MEGIKKNKKIIIIGLIFIFCVGVLVCIVLNNMEKGEVKLESWGIEENSSDSNYNGGQVDGEADGKIADGKDSQPNNGLINNQITKENEIMYIHIIGEVKNEGVISLEKGKRVVDAIEKAGGVTELADLRKINLVYVLSDGQKVRIPSIYDNEKNLKEPYITGGTGLETEGTTKYSGKVNVNTASQTELETLDGIGPSLALKIIEYREKNGGYKNVEELKNVSGIGKAKFEEIKDRVVVK